MTIFLKKSVQEIRQVLSNLQKMQLLMELYLKGKQSKAVKNLVYVRLIIGMEIFHL